MRKFLSTAIIGSLVAIFSLTACSEAEAVETKIYGTFNYKLSNDENSSGKSYMKAENNSSLIGIDASEGIGDRHG